MSLPFVLTSTGVHVRVRLTPRARAARIDGLRPDSAGGARLRVAVVEAPEAGRANQALIALLAREWRLPKSSMDVIAGATDREKLIGVSGDPQTVLGRLLDWSAAQAWGGKADRQNG
jgi:uncharacterized protein